MNKDKIKSIEFDKILLSEDNYRFEPQKNQAEAFREMINKEGQKVYNLAVSLSDGLLSHEFMVVKPTDNGYYVTAEGNRRLTAMMCLRKPELLQNLSQDLYDKFKKLPRYAIPDFVDVCVEDNEEKIKRILELKHNGENEGRGAVPWDATMKARFRQSIGKKDMIVLFLDELVGKKILTKQEAYEEVTRTNWERFLGSKLGKDYLGLKTENGQLVSDPLLINETQIKRIKMVATGLKNQPVDVVYNKDKIKNFIKSLDSNYEFDEKKKTKESTRLSNKPSINKTLKERIYIINPALNWKCSQTRIGGIIGELKSLNIQQFKNAAAILFRSFIDMSTRWYIKNNQGFSLVTNKEGNIDLPASIQKVVEKMVDKGEMDKGEKKPIVRLLAKQNIITILNGYTHDYNVNCIPTEVLDIFDGLQHYLEICIKSGG